MWPFRKRPKPEPDPAPWWAEFFTGAQYADFIAEVLSYFNRQGAKVEIDEGVVCRQDGSDDPPRMGLLNLAQVCNQADRADWSAIISDHFGKVSSPREFEAGLARRSFEDIAPLLAARLWSDEILGTLSEDKIICREDLHGTITALVFDLPESVRNVTREEADRWDRSDDELFSVAVANVRNMPAEAFEQEVEGGRLLGFTGNSFFVASRALFLEDYPHCIGPKGSLVAVPHRHMLLCCPIEDLGVLKVLNLFISATRGMFRDGPGSISPNVYWYRDGEMTNLPYETGDNEVRFMPPPEFVTMLGEFGTTE